MNKNKYMKRCTKAVTLAAAALMRRSITAHGVMRSLKEITQKSWPIGAPKSEAAFWNAEMPGSTSISTSDARSFFIS